MAGTAPGYFARASVQTVVLGAFFFLTLPIMLALVRWSESTQPLLPLYGVTFGLTHFLITGLIYLCTGGLFLVGWLYDLVTLNDQVDELNRGVA